LLYFVSVPTVTRVVGVFVRFVRRFSIKVHDTKYKHIQQILASVDA
jgi:hypothetical protein